MTTQSKPKPRKRAPTRERGRMTEATANQIVDLVAQGKSSFEAARLVKGPVDGHESSSRFHRELRRRPKLRARYVTTLKELGHPKGSDEWQEIEALERLHLAQRAVEEYVLRALDPETNGQATRALHNLCTLLAPEFKPFLDARVRHVHEGVVGIFPVLGPAKLREALDSGAFSDAEVQTVVRFWHWVQTGQANAIEGEALAIDSGEAA